MSLQLGDHDITNKKGECNNVVKHQVKINFSRMTKYGHSLTT